MSSLSRKITLKALEGLTHGQILWDTSCGASASARAVRASITFSRPARAGSSAGSPSASMAHRGRLTRRARRSYGYGVRIGLLRL